MTGRRRSSARTDTLYPEHHPQRTVSAAEPRARRYSPIPKSGGGRHMPEHALGPTRCFITVAAWVARLARRRACDLHDIRLSLDKTSPSEINTRMRALSVRYKQQSAIATDTSFRLHCTCSGLGGGMAFRTCNYRIDPCNIDARRRHWRTRGARPRTLFQ